MEMKNNKTGGLFLAVALLGVSAFASGQHKLPGWALGPFVRPVNATPLITPDNTVAYDPMSEDSVRWESNATFNPAAIVRNGRIYILFRAEGSKGRGIGGHTSRIGLAVSRDGVHIAKRYKSPVLFPGRDDQKSTEWPGGCEDPRVAVTARGTYVVFYTQWNDKVPRLAVATSRDLRHWTKHGPAFGKAYQGRFANMPTKSASIVTRLDGGKLVIARMNGRYFMYWGERHVYGATSGNLTDWKPLVDAQGNLRPLASPRKGYFDSGLDECGPPAIVTGRGILLLYNGKNQPGAAGDTSYTAGSYCAGQMLFSRRDPAKLLARLDKPFLAPAEAFEKSGQYPDGTVFIEGLVFFHGDWYLYYGCADSRVAVAVYHPEKR
jgi:predicted GH43/DUF377 family glycosyl hydrolase